MFHFENDEVVWSSEDLDESDFVKSYAYITCNYYENGNQIMKEIVGYNGILMGDWVKYQDKKMRVVMVSRVGEFGLSETGDLPYSLRVSPHKLSKITEN